MGKSILGKICGMFSKKLISEGEDELALIRYKIARGDNEAALSDLKELTLKGILVPEPYLLEAKLYCEHFNHKMKAIRLIEYYFENPRLEVHAGNVELLEYYDRICADFHQEGKAAAFIKHELGKKGYTEDEYAKLHKCLDGIEVESIVESDGIVIKSHAATASKNLKSVSNRTMFFPADDVKDEPDTKR